MKDYSYFIPGYTGFCPELKEHFGQTYGLATRHILQRNPYLKERLAPVHYRYRRFERVKGTIGKCQDHEGDKYDYPKSKYRTDVHDVRKPRHPTDYEIGHIGKGKYLPDYEDADICRGKHCAGCKMVNTRRTKCALPQADSGQIHKIGLEYACPKYVFIKGFAECVPPEMWTSESRQKLSREHYPCVPCAHIQEYPKHPFPVKKSLVPMPHIHLKEYHPEDCGHKKDVKFGNDRRMIKVPRVRPHRYGGVIPKYTGHIPGMQFSFGEPYGPVSDRLLQMHHGRMKELKIK